MGLMPLDVIKLPETWPPSQNNHRWRELQMRLVRRVVELSMNSFSKMENRVIITHG